MRIRDWSYAVCSSDLLVRLNVSVVVGDGDKMESGGYGTGGRAGYDLYFDPATWQGAVDEALRQALVKLDSIDAPAGEMTVVLGPGRPGILLDRKSVGGGKGVPVRASIGVAPNI